MISRVQRVVDDLLEQEPPSFDQLDLGEPESDEELWKKWKGEFISIAYGGRREMTVEELIRALHFLDQKVRDAYGEPGMQVAFDINEKAILRAILEADPTPAQKEFALNRMEKFFP